MEQNNSTIVNKRSAIEYNFPHDKEQFQNVLRQAQQGKYQQTADVFSDEQIGNHYADSANEINKNTYPVLKEQTHLHENRTFYSTDAASNKKAAYKYQAPVYSNRFSKSQKKFKPAVVIVLLFFLIAAVTVVFLAFFNNTISYSRAEKNYFGGLFNNFFEQCDKLMKPDKSISRQKIEIKASIPAAELTDIDLNDISMYADATVSGETIYGKLGASVGNDSITLENWINKENFTNILSIPEITDLYIYLNSNINSGIEALEQLYADVFPKISELYFELAGEPQIEKDVEFTVTNKTFKADRCVVEINDIGIARLFKETASILLNNDAASEIVYKSLGYKNKSELLKSENYNKMIKEADDIINGVKTGERSFLMTVYMKNRTIVGREIIFSDENSDSSAEKLYFNIYEIPTEKGSFNRIYFKSLQKELNNNTMFPSEIYITCDDEVNKYNKEIHNGTMNLGFTYLNEGSYSFTANYTELAFAEELFQGKINIVFSDAPAFSAFVQLSDGKNEKIIDLSIPNVLTANITFSPSELEFKESPVLIDGQYVEIPSSNNMSASEAEATENLREDFYVFVYNLFNNKDDALNDTEDNNATNDDVHTTPTPTDEDSTPETMTSTESVVTEIPETAPPETTTQETVPPETSAPETVTKQETEPIEAVPNQNTEKTTSSYAPMPTVFIDTGDAQKITGTQIDKFNKGNYYKAEIYVDGEKNATNNVFVTELEGQFDSYIKGRVLQIDFAEGYEYDSALIILTFPTETIRGGRNYPYSSALKGLDRYMVLGCNDGDGYGDKEIKCFKYSNRQIGFIAEKSGYYYVVDMDNYFYNVMKKNPDEIINE